MKILKNCLCFVLTENKLKIYRHHLGNCIELGMLGDAKWTEEENSMKSCNYVYAIIKVQNKEILLSPCILCQKLADWLDQKGWAVVCS